MVGCSLAAAAVLSCKVQPDRWSAPHLAVGTLFDYDRWCCGVSQPFRFSPLWPASWLPAVDKHRGSSLLRSKGFGRSMMSVFSLSRHDAMQLDESLDACDFSRAWLVWSGAAEVAFADAFRFSGVLLLIAVWSLGVGRLVSGWSGLVGTRSGRCVVMPLMSMMPLTFSCTVTLPLLHCLT